MKKHTIILLISFLSISFLSNAQLYKSALGIRLGPTNGITYKTFVNRNAAIEAIGTFRYRGFGLTGLYEVHGRAFNSRDFNWLIGGGGHIYVWGNDRPSFLDNNQRTVLGLDGILGLEAKLRNVPLAVSLDWKPAINIINYSSFLNDEIALSVRYTW
ncbi:hypothetical protein LV89_00398 [Arcicella aurantiaca]|uniref:DUF3575 domain-containing protein n=1 Tax=Arcicella aurantiaca TaxID=591202 RepID=A0A316EH94_9BACT|nr:hypothetical protein [Arcicella aurantiaca]PWK28845.1 hypothetical protein LV89_00398 [Arcicella aurantiaca]